LGIKFFDLLSFIEKGRRNLFFKVSIILKNRKDPLYCVGLVFDVFIVYKVKKISPVDFSEASFELFRKKSF